MHGWKNIEVIEFDVTFEFIDSMLTWNTLENVTEYKYRLEILILFQLIIHQLIYQII